MPGMVEMSGGRIKSGGWRRFERPAGWTARSGARNAHLGARCDERSIPAEAILAGLALADLVLPLPEGRLKLRLSRRGIRRLARAQNRKQARMLGRLVIVASDEGHPITAWLDDARPVRRGPPRDQEDAGLEGYRQ